MQIADAPGCVLKDDSTQKSFFQTKLLGTYVVPHSNSQDFIIRADMITDRLVKEISCMAQG